MASVPCRTEHFKIRSKICPRKKHPQSYNPLILTAENPCFFTMKQLTDLCTYPWVGQTVPGEACPSVGVGACRGEAGPGAGWILEEEAPFQEVQSEAWASAAFLRERRRREQSC